MVGDTRGGEKKVYELNKTNADTIRIYGSIETRTKNLKNQPSVSCYPNDIRLSSGCCLENGPPNKTSEFPKTTLRDFIRPKHRVLRVRRTRSVIIDERRRFTARQSLISVARRLSRGSYDHEPAPMYYYHPYGLRVDPTRTRGRVSRVKR